MLCPPTYEDRLLCNSKSVVSMVHADNLAYKRVRSWAVAENRLAIENLISYNLIEMVLSTASTWLQVQKWWPELVEFMISLDDIRPFSSYLKGVDGRSAHHPPQKIKDAVGKYNRFVIPKLLQAKMIQDSKAARSLRARAFYSLYENNFYITQGRSINPHEYNTG
jgi:hypothetical protein